MAWFESERAKRKKVRASSRHRVPPRMLISYFERSDRFRSGELPTVFCCVVREPHSLCWAGTLEKLAQALEKACEGLKVGPSTWPPPPRSSGHHRVGAVCNMNSEGLRQSYNFLFCTETQRLLCIARRDAERETECFGCAAEEHMINVFFYGKLVHL